MYYKNTYHNLFGNKNTVNPPSFYENEDYIMRFGSRLPYYPYNGGSLTVIYFREGAGQLIIDGEKTSIGNHKFIVANPYSDWEYINNENKEIDVLSFVLSEEMVSNFLYGSITPNLGLLDNPYASLRKDFFFTKQTFDARHYASGRVLSRIYTNSNQDHYPLSCPKEIAFDVLESIFDDQLKANKLVQKVKANKTSTQKEVFKRILTAYEYIVSNTDRQISIKELSLVSALSEFHLYRSFKYIFGRSPHQFMIYQRMKKAKFLLEKKQLKASEVACTMNFPDLSTFSKLYKKTYGVSPSQIRI